MKSSQKRENWRQLLKQAGFRKKEVGGDRKEGRKKERKKKTLQIRGS